MSVRLLLQIVLAIGWTAGYVLWSHRGIGPLCERHGQRWALRGRHPQRRHRAPDIDERLLGELLRFGQGLLSTGDDPWREWSARPEFASSESDDRTRLMDQDDQASSTT